MALNTTPRTWTGSEVVTAGELDIEVRDAIAGLQAAWDVYAPAAVNFTPGAGNLLGRHKRVGKDFKVRINFNATGTSSYTASAFTISLPFAVHATSEQILPLKALLSTGVILGGLGIVAAGASVVQIFVPASSTSSALIPMTSAIGNPGTTGSIVIEGILEVA